MNKNSKLFLIIIPVAVIGLILLLVGILGIKNNNNNNQSGGSSQKAANSKVIKGVEYIDASRNLDDTGNNNFSFFISKDEKKFLTFKQSETNTSFSLDSVSTYNDCYAAMFKYTGGDYSIANPAYIIVSDDHYISPDGENFYENKTLLWEDGKLSSYVAKQGYRYNHQYLMTIGNTKVGFYATTHKEDDKSLTKAVKALIEHISVDKSVGYYYDYYLNEVLPSWSKATLKSYKYIQRVNLASADIINLGEYTAKMYESATNIIDENTIDYATIGKYKLGYIISEFDSDGIVMYLYDPNTKRQKQLVKVPDFKKYNVEPSVMLELYKNRLIVTEGK